MPNESPEIFSEVYSDFMNIKGKIVKNQPFSGYFVNMRELF